MAEFLSDVAPANIARIYARLPLSRLRLPGASCVYATKIAAGFGYVREHRRQCRADRVSIEMLIAAELRESAS